jgi:GxxExxY protein
MDGSEHLNQLTGTIIGAAIRVHKRLGPGLLEHTYTRCLQHELERSGHRADSEVLIDLTYEELVIPAAYRIDLLVDDIVVVEVKAVQKLAPVHHSQVVTYLKVSGMRVGLLFNFNVVSLPEGMKRFVNNLS